MMLFQVVSKGVLVDRLETFLLYGGTGKPSANNNYFCHVTISQTSANNKSTTFLLYDDQENTPQPPKTLETQNPNQESQNPNEESSKPVQDNENPDQEMEKEEEGECPFCAYMKGGECRETFTNWEKCIESNGDEDIVEKCFEVTSALRKCMEANQDYYAPILQAEKLAEKQALDELEQEKPENAKEANEKQETS
ncbi:GCK-like protein [Artemisia annua]|uniref:GCK-like protein n=1 Tax=Artemisia annua TaxID=35608 RepID=A0A2U1PTI8_ARTAN|nr:GCK-like protein [Artemisia annua]